jgi:AraC family transcriptional regulator
VASSLSHTVFAPDHFANLAERFGHRRLFTVAWDGFCLQQYECRAGGWQHEAIGACRIAVQETGQPRVERAIDGRAERQLRPSGLVSISPPDSSQRWSWNCAMRLSLFFIDGAVLDELSIANGLSSGVRLRTPLVEDDKVIRFTVASLVEHYGAQNGIPHLLLSAAGRHVAAHLLARYSTDRHGELPPRRMADWQIKRVLDYMESRLEDDIGLGELAAVAGMRSHYFCRAFRLSLGVPPYRFLINRRIERAKLLLSSTDTSITGIALSLGFANHAHFSTTFRRTVGRSPAAYRKLSL